MKYCVVRGCREKQQKGNGVQFHRFPFNRPDILKKWIEAIARENWMPSAYSNICSKHFAPDSYQIRPNAPVKFLKVEAIPTIFDVPTTTRKEKDHGQKKRSRAQINNVEKDRVNCGESVSVPKGLKVPTILRRNRKIISRPLSHSNSFVENAAEETSKTCDVEPCTLINYLNFAEDSNQGIENNVGTDIEIIIINSNDIQSYIDEIS
ncbi:hypothetical protein LSTR_LSTR013654 [Laodelphax striatellus]|uniref:THAP-type domain-containing protein n=1 Tax=Laodelphax striatellus TaxID=195883 RepID=A0A482WKN9_LAOST|nr:hypothetical protein LSTR_LSTR013654 [Laodelphax striatellus]